MIVRLASSRNVWHPLLNGDAVGAQSVNFQWVVGHQAHFIHADVLQHGCTERILSPISRKVECQVCIKRVEADVL